MTTPPAHRPIFVGTLDRPSGRVTYRLIYACEREPLPGDFVTTNPPDITCEACLAAMTRPESSHGLLIGPVDPDAGRPL